jgi:hypothetical protein
LNYSTISTSFSAITVFARHTSGTQRDGCRRYEVNAGNEHFLSIYRTYKSLESIYEDRTKIEYFVLRNTFVHPKSREEWVNYYDRISGIDDFSPDFIARHRRYRKLCLRVFYRKASKIQVWFLKMSCKYNFESRNYSEVKVKMPTIRESLRRDPSIPTRERPFQHEDKIFNILNSDGNELINEINNLLKENKRLQNYNAKLQKSLKEAKKSSKKDNAEYVAKLEAEVSRRKELKRKRSEVSIEKGGRG